MEDEESASTSPKPEESEEDKQFRETAKRLLLPYMKQQDEGFNRVGRLVDFAGLIKKPAARDLLFGVSGEDASQDILRAAVVLIHAHLEEFLRTISRVLLPEGNEACLNEIPLAGLKGRPEKFTLGRLVQHKGKLVDDVLRESVYEHLERSNYNSTDEISNLLRSLGFDVSKHEEEFPAIQQMIDRRHQIVHRADRFEPALSTVLNPIRADDVSRWLTATNEFMQSFDFPLLQKLIALQDKTPTTPRRGQLANAFAEYLQGPPPGEGAPRQEVSVSAASQGPWCDAATVIASTRTAWILRGRRRL